MYLLDTNVISEVRKKKRCDTNVAKWYKSVDPSELFLSVLVMGEIRKGVESVRNRNPRQAQHLEIWLEDLQLDFEDRVLGIDARVADEWGKMSSKRTLPIVDCYLAASAKVHHMTLVTRNVKDFVGLGANVFNPFEYSL